MLPSIGAGPCTGAGFFFAGDSRWFCFVPEPSRGWSFSCVEPGEFVGPQLRERFDAARVAEAEIDCERGASVLWLSRWAWKTGKAGSDGRFRVLRT